MAGELLLDTGALVALLDRSQAVHHDYVRFFESWNRAVVTTEAVLTEATHLLGRVPRGRVACVEFILSRGAVLVPSSLTALARCRALLEQYADVPMDFADATLVVLAEEIGTNVIFTTDRRDFDIYRAGGRRRFHVVPSASRG